MASFKIGKVVLSSLFKKPATLMYPVVPRKWEERTRGSIAITEADCILCGICSKKCPTNAITVDRTKRTWTIERMQCIQCCCCVEVCPKKCLHNKNEYTTPETQKIVDAFTIPQAQKAEEKAEGAKKGETAAAGGGDIKCDLKACIFCGICGKKCPADAIKVDRAEKSWTIDDDACLHCNVCVDACPKKCLTSE